MARDMQFSVSHHSVEDRLLLRAVFADGVEFSFWFTRRFTAGFMELADRVARDVVKGDLDARARGNVADFTRQAAAQEANYGQDYQSGEPHAAMTEGPRLVTGARFEPREGERFALVLRLDKGGAVTITLAAANLWSLIHLIGERAAKANWGLAQNPARPVKKGPARMH